MTIAMTGPVVMMALGPYKFSITTAAFQELSRSSEYRWAGQERFGQHAALQFTGPGGDTITLSGVIFPEHLGGAGQVDAMRALAAQGQPQVLIDGMGNIMGEWVIESIQEQGSVFAAAGIPRRQAFTLAIRRYSAQGEGESIGTPAFLAAATASTGPFPTQSAATSALGAFGNQVGSAVSMATGALTNAMAGINTAVAGAANVVATANRAVTAANRMAGAVQAMRQVGSQISARNGLQGILSAASTLAGAAATASSAAGTLSGHPGFRDVQLAASRLAGEATRASSQASALQARIETWPGT